MAEGELDEARDLLDFLEVPGAGQHTHSTRSTSSPDITCARGYEEALDLAAILLRELPEVGQQHKFRSFVGKWRKVWDSPRRSRSCRRANTRF